MLQAAVLLKLIKLIKIVFSGSNGLIIQCLKVQSCKLKNHREMIADVYPENLAFQLFISFAVIYSWNLLFNSFHCLLCLSTTQ